jgi:hypothetical protein
MSEAIRRPFSPAQTIPPRIADCKRLEVEKLYAFLRVQWRIMVPKPQREKIEPAIRSQDAANAENSPTEHASMPPRIMKRSLGWLINTI